MIEKLDLNKPLQSRHGCPCRLICSDRKSSNGESLVILIDYGPFEEVVTRRPDGIIRAGYESDGDIINAPEKPKEKWVYAWLSESGECYIQEEPVDREKFPEICGSKRIVRVREGEFDD